MGWAFAARCWISPLWLQRPVGEIKLSGSMGEVRHLESVIRVAKNAGARRILLPMQCMADVVKIPSELLATVQPLFYMDAIDAAKKALDIY